MFRWIFRGTFRRSSSECSGECSGEFQLNILAQVVQANFRWTSSEFQAHIQVNSSAYSGECSGEYSGELSGEVQANFRWISLEFHLNFQSSKVHLKFRWSPHEFHLNFTWSSDGFSGENLESECSAECQVNFSFPWCALPEIGSFDVWQSLPRGKGTGIRIFKRKKGPKCSARSLVWGHQNLWGAEKLFRSDQRSLFSFSDFPLRMSMWRAHARNSKRQCWNQSSGTIITQINPRSHCWFSWWRVPEGMSKLQPLWIEKNQSDQYPSTSIACDNQPQKVCSNTQHHYPNFGNQTRAELLSLKLLRNVWGDTSRLQIESPRQVLPLWWLPNIPIWWNFRGWFYSSQWQDLFSYFLKVWLSDTFLPLPLSPFSFPFLLSLSLSLTFLPLHIKIIIKKRGKKKKCFFPFFSKNSKPTKKEGFFRCTPQPATFSLPRSRARLQSYLSIFDPIFVALRPQSPFHSIPGKKIAHFSSIQQKMHWKGKMKKRKMWRKFFFSLYRAITSQGGGI